MYLPRLPPVTSARLPCRRTSMSKWRQNFLSFVPQQTVSKAIHRFNKLGHEGDVAEEEESALPTLQPTKRSSKSDFRNSRVSIRKIARETGIRKSFVHRISKKGTQPQGVQAPKNSDPHG
ncbi:hypothetical protein LAZ67_14000289 [Cordylochernes scorpioides]|uniref:DUF4817 domain-containing protein n=1 Tax=Cordylochernes scorpioides TaxID=51811 RepID=A0ABY6L5G8_9ARAC|nr:hypothetical protein LAZ67_14000289 [Cordylochernes scorpioides]